MKFPIFFIFLTTIYSCCYAQNQIGIIPQINTNFKLGDTWKVNSKIEGRQLFFQNPYPADLNEVEFERLDLEIVATRKLGKNTTVGGGYLIRRENSSFTHRFIQQFAVSQKLTASRLTHRFRTDQTFEKNETVQFRLRYRISWENPLNGPEVDPREFYLKLNNEYLGILQDGRANLEIRTLASLGYNISDRNQIETGIDYRIEKLIGSDTEHKLFLNIGLYHSF